MRTSRTILLSLLLSSCEVENISRREEPLPPPTKVEPTKPVAPATPEAPIVVAPKKSASPSPYVGSETAKVTIVAFSDFQCPFCAKADGTLTELQRELGSDLRIVWKDLPLETIHKSAKPAAIAARAVAKQGNDKFFAFHTTLFMNQRSLPLDAKEYESYAAAIPGLDIEQWKKDIADPATAELVAADVALATSLGVKSTPNFFVNGELLAGAQPKEKFTEVIARQRARAEGVLSSGVSPEELYDQLVSTGATTRVTGAAGSVIYKVPD